MSKLKLTHKEMLKDLLINQLELIRQKIIETLKEIDHIEEQIDKRIK